MGAPLYTKPSNALPFGAIVCTRARRSTTDDRYFLKAERELLRDVAAIGSERLRALWNRENDRNRNLAKLAAGALRIQQSVGSTNPSEFNKHVLKGLKKKFGFSRLLLALSNESQT